MQPLDITNVSNAIYELLNHTVKYFHLPLDTLNLREDIDFRDIYPIIRDWWTSLPVPQKGYILDNVSEYRVSVYDFLLDGYGSQIASRVAEMFNNDSCIKIESKIDFIP